MFQYGRKDGCFQGANAASVWGGGKLNIGNFKRFILPFSKLYQVAVVARPRYGSKNLFGSPTGATLLIGDDGDLGVPRGSGLRITKATDLERHMTVRKGFKITGRA